MRFLGNGCLKEASELRFRTASVPATYRLDVDGLKGGCACHDLCRAWMFQDGVVIVRAPTRHGEHLGELSRFQRVRVLILSDRLVAFCLVFLWCRDCKLNRNKGLKRRLLRESG